MHNEIVTDPLSAEDLWSDLRLNLDWLQQARIRQVLILFGFSWGSFMHKGPWQDMAVPTDEVEARVRAAEANAYGMLGDDNLYVTISEFHARLQYSHETDIHLSYAEKNPFVEGVLRRWVSNQWFLEKRQP